MSDDYRDSVYAQTHFGLRVALAVLAGMLAASVIIQISWKQCMQASISAYYYTPVHAIFIAALFAIGTCLIIYRGNTAP